MAQIKKLWGGLMVAGVSIVALGACSSESGGGDVEDSALAIDSVGEAREATGTGATIVSTQRIEQIWGQDHWGPDTPPGTPPNPRVINVSNLQAGDAIVTLGLYWVSSGTGASPMDNKGTLLAAVNQVQTGYNPPVAAQIYYEFNANPAVTHTITPPDLAYGGDGVFYVVVVRGLTGSLVSTGKKHQDWDGQHALQTVGTQLSSSASVGDFVVAIGGEDDYQAYGTNAGVTLLNSPGWQTIGTQQDATVNVPSGAYSRIVAATGNQALTWTWNDTFANVTTAAIAAFR